MDTGIVYIMQCTLDGNSLRKAYDGCNQFKVGYSVSGSSYPSSIPGRNQRIRKALACFLTKILELPKVSRSGY